MRNCSYCFYLILSVCFTLIQSLKEDLSRNESNLDAMNYEWHWINNKWHLKPKNNKCAILSIQLIFVYTWFRCVGGIDA